MQYLFLFFEIILIRHHFLLHIDKFLHRYVLDLKDEMTDIRMKSLPLLFHPYTIYKPEQEILKKKCIIINLFIAKYILHLKIVQQEIIIVKNHKIGVNLSDIIV